VDSLLCVFEASLIAVKKMVKQILISQILNITTLVAQLLFLWLLVVLLKEWGF